MGNAPERRENHEIRAESLSGSRFNANRSGVNMNVGVSFDVIGGLGMRRMRAPGAAGLGAGAKGFVHDLLDGTGTAAALRTTAEAAIDLARGTRRLGGGHDVSHVMVGKDVAGTNDHGMKASSRDWTILGPLLDI
jgi:hypothetical protein